MDLTGPKTFDHPNNMGKNSFYYSKFKLVQGINDKDLEDIKGKFMQG